VEEQKEEVVEEETKKPWKPAGGVSLFGGVDLFAGKKPSFTEEDVKDTESKPVTKKGKGYNTRYAP
jgi:hypothetical protein